MYARNITPILNVSNLSASVDWFARLGWDKLWEWGDPPSFGAVGSGTCEIFLCHNAQGGRGKSDLPVTMDVEGAEAADQGVWMSVWVDDVDTIHQHCVTNDIEITHPPENMPWQVREMHVRHPDGHVFRISQAIGSEPCDAP